MVDAGSIWIRLGLNTDDLLFGLDKAKYGLLEWRGETAKSSADMLKWGAAITAQVAPVLALGTAVVALTQKYGTMAAQLRDLSLVTGLTTDKLQQISYAATLSGDNFEMVARSISKLSLSMAAAEDATSQTAEAFARLGVTPTGKTVDRVFDETAVALIGMENITLRNQIAMELYGKSYQDLIPFMNTYIEKRKEIEAISLLSPEELESNEKAKQHLDALGKRFETLVGHSVAYFTNLHDAGQELEAQTTVLDRLFAGQGIKAFFPGLEDSYQLGTAPEFKMLKRYPEQSAALRELTDRYKDKTEAEILLISTEEELIVAQEEYNQALIGGDQDAFDVASRKLQSLKNKYSELTDKMREAATTSAQVAAVWSDSVMVGSAGSQMQLFMQREMELGTTYNEALQKWAQGEPTSSIPEAGTLRAVRAANVAGTTDTSVTPTKTETPGGKIAEVEDEYKERIEALENLTEDTSAEYQKQTDAFRQHIDDMIAYRESQYPEIEKMDLTHWATTEEIAKVALQKMLEFMADSVNFAGKYPIIQNYIVMSKDGPDWSPQPFNPVAAPKLESADFTTVRESVREIVAKGLDAGAGSSGASTPTAVKVDVVVKDQTAGGVKIDAKATTKALAGVEGLGGAMI